ncbi:MAG: phytanoyl-CoA dioxygenase family protein [Candidatus Latescibacteria bacterium]|nr:phytanoyl-CoA dioxygenase family protein [Candidatus Latescibacterota bacterium]
MDITQDHKDAFDRDGFILLRGFLTPAETADVEANIQRFIDQILPQTPETTAFYEDTANPASIKRLQKMGEHDPYFATMTDAPPYAGLARALLADEVVPKQMQWFNKPARLGSATPPHQDGFYFMLEPNEAITLWLALDDIDEDNGCIRYVRGSHHRGIRPHQRSNVVGFSQGLPDYSDQDRAQEEAICAQPGDLFAHHSLTIHRADGNPSPRRRAALGLVYFAARAKEDAERAERYRQQLYQEWEQQGKI